MGKTSLVIKVRSLAASDSLRIATLDIFGCRSPADFLTAYAAAVIKEALLERDMILLPARGIVLLADPILKLWLQRRVWPAG